MKVKCKICGEIGFWDSGDISEYHAPKMKFITDSFGKKPIHICRECIIRVLDVVVSEQHQIRQLHYPKHSKTKSFWEKIGKW